MQTIDFLGIGAPRAGTTWLWNILFHHPNIWMPPRKELHYFDRSPKYPSPSYLAGDSFARRMFGFQPPNAQFRKKLFRSLAKILLLRSNWREIKWNVRYLLRTIDDSWYLSLFEDAGYNIVKGEITPAYCLLDVADVQHVRELLPDLKIIYLLRNPVDRAWSDLRFDWTMGKFKKMNQPEALRAAAERLGSAPRGQYLRTIHTWKTFFSDKNIFIGFYDDILARPEEFSKEIFKFLSVDYAAKLPDKLLTARINAARDIQMPDYIARLLSESYLPQVKILCEMFPGGYPEKWLAELRENLDQN